MHKADRDGGLTLSVPLGRSLLALLAQAQNEVVLVAPFVKRAVLKQCLDAVAPQVVLTVVTRWRPEEVALGVSDLEVFELIEARAGARLLLVNQLHAKYYRADDHLMIGSANLTATALGWRTPQNIELLYLVDVEVAALHHFEASLLRVGVEPDASVRDAVATAAEAIAERMAPAPWTVDEGDHLGGPVSQVWLPHTRYPDQIWLAYSGRWDDLTRAAKEQVTHDLRHIRPAPGLSEERLRDVIAAQLLMHSFVRWLDVAIDERPRRFGENRSAMRSWLQAHDIEFDATTAMQTLQRWLLFFLPSKFVAPESPYSEVLRRPSS